MAEILKNVLLKNLTTFQIGGKAEYFFEAQSKEEIIKTIQMAKQKNLPFFILGGGSNVLFSDKGFKGLVIKTQNSKLKTQNSKIQAEAGASLKELVSAAAENGLAGLEWATGIPGTVGGAIYGNAAAFSKSMLDIVEKVEIFDSQELKIKNYQSEDCQFDYRKSIFKENKNLIILSAVLELEKGDKDEINEKIEEFFKYRRERHPLQFPSAGCVFKNPENASAAQLIEKCGLKGKKIGQAQVSEKHANFIINLGEARSQDILELIELIKNKIRNKFGLELEKELEVIHY